MFDIHVSIYCYVVIVYSVHRIGFRGDYTRRDNGRMTEWPSVKKERINDPCKDGKVRKCRRQKIGPNWPKWYTAKIMTQVFFSNNNKKHVLKNTCINQFVIALHRSMVVHD